MVHDISLITSVTVICKSLVIILIVLCVSVVLDIVLLFLPALFSHPKYKERKRHLFL
jgi:hypothetical protein